MLSKTGFGNLLFSRGLFLFFLKLKQAFPDFVIGQNGHAFPNDVSQITLKCIKEPGVLAKFHQSPQPRFHHSRKFLVRVSSVLTKRIRTNPVFGLFGLVQTCFPVQTRQYEVQEEQEMAVIADLVGYHHKFFGKKLCGFDQVLNLQTEFRLGQPLVIRRTLDDFPTWHVLNVRGRQHRGRSQGPVGRRGFARRSFLLIEIFQRIQLVHFRGQKNLGGNLELNGMFQPLANLFQFRKQVPKVVFIFQTANDRSDALFDVLCIPSQSTFHRLHIDTG